MPVVDGLVAHTVSAEKRGPELSGFEPNSIQTIKLQCLLHHENRNSFEGLPCFEALIFFLFFWKFEKFSKDEGRKRVVEIQKFETLFINGNLGS